MGRIAIVGEAFGEAEEREQAPFVGYSGQELTRMLSEAGIHRADCFLTNVLNLRPPANKIEALCGPKTSGIKGYPPLTKGKHLRSEFSPELGRLASELDALSPNIVIALGNTAMWALLGKTAISKFRGTTEMSTHTLAGLKVLPTYHPAAVCRQWELRPVTILDLAKALRESAFPEVRRPNVRVHIPETPADFPALRELIQDRVATDIETSGSLITIIGFAPNPRTAIVVPFYDRRRKDRSYWKSPADERSAWDFVGGILRDKSIKKTFQNGLYDIAFIWRTTGIKVMGAENDTMLLHHALQPEALKGLGFLGSIYTDHGAWKQMRKRTTTIKKDE